MQILIWRSNSDIVFNDYVFYVFGAAEYKRRHDNMNGKGCCGHVNHQNCFLKITVCSSLFYQIPGCSGLLECGGFFVSSERSAKQMGVYARFICRHRDTRAVPVCHLWDETKKLRTAEHQKDS